VLFDYFRWFKTRILYFLIMIFFRCVWFFGVKTNIQSLFHLLHLVNPWLNFINLCIDIFTSNHHIFILFVLFNSWSWMTWRDIFNNFSSTINIWVEATNYLFSLSVCNIAVWWVLTFNWRKIRILIFVISYGSLS